MRLSLYTGSISGLNGKYNTHIECIERYAKAGFRYFSFGESYMIGKGIMYYDDWERQANKTQRAN